MSNRAQGPGGDLFGVSQTLWRDVPIEFCQGFGGDRDVGWMRGDDFTNFATRLATVSSLTDYFSEGNYYRAFEVKGGGSTTQGIIPDEAPWTVPAATAVYTPNGQGIRYPGSSIIPTPGSITFTPASAADNMQLCMGADQARATASYPHGQFTPYPLSTTAANNVGGDVIFETRIKLSDLNNGGTGNGASLNAACTSFFIGLASTLAVASAVPVNNTTYSTTPGLLGFGCLSGDNPGQIGLVYNKAGGATVSDQAAFTSLNLLTMGGVTGIGTGTLSPLLYVAGAGGIPTTTPAVYKGAYFKLGFRYSASAGTLTPYINGVAQDGRNAPNRIIQNATTFTLGGVASVPGTASTTLWPAAPMTFAAGLWQTGSTTLQTMTIDWWRAFQFQA